VPPIAAGPTRPPLFFGEGWKASADANRDNRLSATKYANALKQFQG
jgi:hypothetical protein